MAPRFLDLSREIQYEIFDLAYSGSGALKITFNKGYSAVMRGHYSTNRPPREAAISKLLVSRSWLAEALPIHLRTNAVSLWSAVDLNRFCACPLVRGNLRTVHITHEFLPLGSYNPANYDHWRPTLLPLMPKLQSMTILMDLSALSRKLRCCLHERWYQSVIEDVKFKFQDVKHVRLDQFRAGDMYAKRKEVLEYRALGVQANADIR